MKFEDYTKQQQKAIIDSGHNILVSAGAGSGKTQVLTERVIHFVRDKNYKLKDFLILTFTKLAASEMKERIRKALIDEGLDEFKNVDLADICTFDSFALSIVKKYHFILNVSPNISIIDETIIDVRKRKLIEEAFDEEYRNRDELFTNLIRSFCFKDDEDIRKLVLKFYNKALEQASPEKYLLSFCDEYYSDKKINEIKNEVVSMLRDGRDKFIDEIKIIPGNIHITCKKADFDGTLQEFYEPYINQIKNAETYDEFLELNEMDIPSTTVSRSCSEDEKIAKNKFTGFLTDFLKTLKGFPPKEENFVEFVLSFKPYANKLIEIILKVDKKLKEFKNKYQVFEFSDITRMSLQLVNSNEEIRNEIKNSYKMIMVDEYQDTSLVQDDFVFSISNNNVYMVGDIKQSIYRFRLARCEIFNEKYNKFKKHEGGEVIDLNRNFRSRKEVLDDINYIFKQEMTNELGGADYLNEHIIEFGNKNYELDEFKNQNFHSDILVVPDEDSKTEAEAIALDIVKKINEGFLVLDYKDKVPYARKCRFSDFCILIDRTKEFDKYSKVFQKWKIPLTIEKDEDISNSNIVNTLKSILYMIKCIKNKDFESDDFKKAYLSLARSFIYEYRDDDIYDIVQNNAYNSDKIVIQLSNLIYKYSYLSLADLFKQIMLELDVYHKFVILGDIANNEKYLNTFIGYFEAMCELDYTIDDFISFLANIHEYDLKLKLKLESSNENCVTLMNVHKSKGLEFGIIYYSGLNKEFNRKDISDKYKVSDKYGLIIPDLEGKYENFLNSLNKKYETAEDTSEKLRLFYVDLTRAKEKMIFVTQDYIHNKNYKYLDFKILEDEKRLIKKYNLMNGDKKNNAKNIINEYLNGNIDCIILDHLLRLFTPYYCGAESLDFSKDNILEQLDFIINTNEKKFEYEFKLINKLKEKGLKKEDIVLELIKIRIINKKPIKDFYLVIEKIGVYIHKENRKEFSENYSTQIKESKDMGLTLEQCANAFVFDYSYFVEYSLEAMSFFEFEFLIPTLDDDYEKIFKILELEPTDDFDPDFQISKTWFKKVNYENSLKEEKLHLYELIKKHKDIFDTLNDANKILLIKYINEINAYEYEITSLLRSLQAKSINIEEFKQLCADVRFEYDDDEVLDIYLEAIYCGNLPYNLVSNLFIAAAKFNELYLSKDFVFNKKPIIYPVLENKFNMYQKGLIEYKEFVKYINCFGYQENIMFKILDDSAKKRYVYDDFDEIVSEIGFIKDISEAKSFLDFFKPFEDYRKFNFNGESIKNRKPLEICTDFEEIKHENLKLNDFKFEPQEVNTFKASKELKLDANKKAMEFGTKIHFIMEVVDFKNPDYTKLSNFFQNIVKRFLSSDLMKNIKDGEIYKELEFYDEVNLTNGIIDLMVIYEDHIHIIDYKTRNIDDESYDEQLRIYKRYIKQKSDKEIRTYLYSLETGECRETK